jgi:WD repeat-containing protein 23
MSVGWENGRGGSIIARHEWKGLSKRPGALEDWARKETEEESDRSRRWRARQARTRQHQRQVPGAFETSEDSE